MERKCQMNTLNGLNEINDNFVQIFQAHHSATRNTDIAYQLCPEAPDLSFLTRGRADHELPLPLSASLPLAQDHLNPTDGHCS